MVFRECFKGMGERMNCWILTCTCDNCHVSTESLRNSKFRKHNVRHMQVPLTCDTEPILQPYMVLLLSQSHIWACRLCRSCTSFMHACMHGPAIARMGINSQAAVKRGLCASTIWEGYRVLTLAACTWWKCRNFFCCSFHSLQRMLCRLL